MFSIMKVKQFKANSNENLNICLIFKPLYVVLCVFGLFPYNLRFQESRRGLTIIQKSIYFNALCAVSFMVFMLCFLAVHVQYVYNSIEDTTMTRELMTQMNYVLEMFVSTMFCLVAYISTFRNRCMYVKTINKIANLIQPSNLAIKSAIKKFKSQFRIVMIFLSIVAILQFLVNITRDSTYWKTFLVVVTFILPQMIQFTWLAFFYVLILMLVVLLTSVRENICSLSQINALDCFIKSYVKVLTLQNVESVYTTASKLKREINKAFQASLLFTTLQCFHSIVSEAHIIYHMVIVDRNFTLHSIVNCSIWIGYQIFKIYMLSRSGNMIKQEVLKIGQQLHNIRTEKYDSRLLLEIQHFTSLMSFQGDGLSAYGLFPLDATLLSKILASSAMYVIILVQFDKN